MSIRHKTSARLTTLALTVLVSGCVSRNIASPTTQDLRPLVQQCGMEGKMDAKHIGGRDVAVTLLSDDLSDQGFMCVLRAIEARGFMAGFTGKM
jgi:hypothetical protein